MDPVDGQILGLLRENARVTFREIGDVVGLSAPAITRRVEKLVSAGAIRAFTVVLDPAVLGWTTEAYVEVRCKADVAPQDLRRRLETIPEITSACTVTGSADALVHLLAKDVTHLGRAIEKLRDGVQIDHTRSAVVLSRLIDRPR